MQTTSEKGVEFVERHEGVVLKTYRDPVGILTIGAGLTKASGVIDPKPGQTITRKEASRLLAQALNRNYEPRVRKAMPGTQQHEFDAAVSFDFNTGAITRASWVKHWLNGRDWPKVQAGIKAWRKGGGCVLPGLVRRRDEEFELLRLGLYHPAMRTQTPPAAEWARFAVVVEPAEILEIATALTELGYDAGGTSQIKAAAVRRFQFDHDLTVDAVIGRATLSTLQRRIDARRKSTQTAAGAVAGGGGAVLPEAAPDWALWLVLAVIGLVALRLAWSYRDVVAVKIENLSPRLAKQLRSI